MAYIRFWHRFRLSRFLLLNVSKKGISISFISKILNITFGKNGVRFTTGLRGTGISFTEYKKYK